MFQIRPEFAAWDIDHSRFEVTAVIGKGQYGTVARATDHLSNTTVAIKKIDGLFSHPEIAKRIFREVKILRQLQHANVVKLLHISCPGIHNPSVNLDNFSCLYIVLELVEGGDLDKLLSSFQTLEDIHTQFSCWRSASAHAFLQAAT
jgi:serine/threonine protein kinase